MTSRWYRVISAIAVHLCRRPIHDAIKTKVARCPTGETRARNLFTLCFALVRAKTIRSTFATDLPPIKCKSARSLRSSKRVVSGRFLDRSKSDREYVCISYTDVPLRQALYTATVKTNSLSGSWGFVKPAIETRVSNTNARTESLVELCLRQSKIYLTYNHTYNPSTIQWRIKVLDSFPCRARFFRIVFFSLFPSFFFSFSLNCSRRYMSRQRDNLTTASR